MDRLRELEPNYSRLCCVFESALALQLALETTGLPDFKAWFPTLCRLGTFQAPDAQEAKTVPGLATTHVLKKSKTNVAVISGGVTVGPKEKVASAPPNVSPLLTGSAVPQLPADGKATNWWWD